jgi:hypothetical protein
MGIVPPAPKFFCTDPDVAVDILPRLKEWVFSANFDKNTF